MTRTSIASKPERLDINYGIYRIIAGSPAGRPKAVAYAGSRLIETVSEDTVDATLHVLKSLLDARSAALRKGRRDGIPAAGEFSDLLASLPAVWTDKLLPILRAHASRFPDGAPVTDIARSTGVDQTIVWHQYGRFGRKVASALAVEPPENDLRLNRTMEAVLLFAELSRESVADEWTVRLRPELMDALG